MDRQDLVGIIIVTWNKEKFVLELLESLSKLDYQNYEINVIDNASGDSTVKSIKKRFPNVNLIENKENLGGTGGFNTGMRFALSYKNYDYIWLLDNDAYVEPGTLTWLIKTMKIDTSIGIVGSLICHPDNKDTVVEQGGMVHWNYGIWDTCHRNEKKSQLKQAIKDVDYVAACSMLIKPLVLKTAGIFDEKMFVHWDDVEFCLRAKRNGFRVVATKNSVIYHYAEKNLPLVFSYYDLRNAFLTMSYHLKRSKQKIGFLLQLRRLMKVIVFAKIFNEKKLHQVIKPSLDDFLNHIFYRFSYTLDSKGLNTALPKRISPSLYKNFLILPYGTIFEMIECAEQIKSNSNDSKITLMIQKERVSLIENEKLFDSIVTFRPLRAHIFYTLRQIIKLSFSKYDVGVIASTKILLPVYAVSFKSNIIFNKEDKSFYLSKYNRSGLWKIVYASIVGEILALYNLPKVVSSSKLLQSNKPDYQIFK
jgi:GT2 family glycosyltransferase